jgi:hypothetical protein
MPCMSLCGSERSTVTTAGSLFPSTTAEMGIEPLSGADGADLGLIVAGRERCT